MNMVKDKIKGILPAPILKKLQEKKRSRDTALLTAWPRVPFDSAAFPPGINLIGNLRHHTGLGQSCRLLAAELLESGVPCALRNYALSDRFGTGLTDLDSRIGEESPYSVNLFHIPMHEFAPAFRELGGAVWDRHYNIAFWLWELEEFPAEWVPLISQLDEIWTPSEFVSQSLRKVTEKPVITVPYHVTAPWDRKADRAFFGLPEDLFLFLVMYDVNSMADRKNPAAAVEAYREAFSAGSQGAACTGLVLKAGFSGDSFKALAALQNTLPEHHLFFLTETYPKETVNALIRNCDVFISLHRSEGFALVPAEAMLLGTPTVCTNWSANTEFQTPESACLVKYQMRPVGKDLWPYRKENVWADADPQDAARYLRKLYEDPAYYRGIRENALQQAEQTLGPERPKIIIRQRFQQIITQNAASGSDSDPVRS